MVKLKRETIGLTPKHQDNLGRGQLSGVQPRVHAYVLLEKDIMLDLLVVAMREQHEIEVERWMPRCAAGR